MLLEADVFIRDERALCKITNYIKNNPKRWFEDRLYFL